MKQLSEFTVYSRWKKVAMANASEEDYRLFGGGGVTVCWHNTQHLFAGC